MASAHLSHRGVVRLSGEDKRDFLQGLVTQDMRLVGEDRLLYSCFLTPQGKYLTDFFITQRGDDFLIDIDRAFSADFIKRLNMFKLRSKVTIVEAPEYKIYAFWDETRDDACPDPRAEDIGYRLMTVADIPVTGGDYAVWQAQNGLPDRDDFTRERSMMLEMNMDLLHAVSWDKGCYMGQELTARTHYRALIKKRALPVYFPTGDAIAKDGPVQRDGKTIGFILGQHGDYLLALMQLDAMKESQHVTINGHFAEVVIPKWFSFDGD